MKGVAQSDEIKIVGQNMNNLQLPVNSFGKLAQMFRAYSSD